MNTQAKYDFNINETCSLERTIAEGEPMWSVVFTGPKRREETVSLLENDVFED